MNRAGMVEHFGTRVARELSKLQDDPERSVFLGQGHAIGEAVSAALSGPNLLGSHRQQVYALMVGELRKGTKPRLAAKRALEAAYADEDAHGAEPTQRQRTIGQLAARYESALAAGNDPDRAASIAANGLGGGLHGLAPHLAQAIRDGLEPDEAATQAYDAFHGGGGQSFGDQLLDRGGNRPRTPEKRQTRRTWDDLNSNERMLVAGHLASIGRGGEEPSSRDISEAFEALSISG